MKVRTGVPLGTTIFCSPSLYCSVISSPEVDLATPLRFALVIVAPGSVSQGMWPCGAWGGMVCTSRATSFPSGPFTAVDPTRVPALISESVVFLATATWTSFANSTFFSAPSFDFTVRTSPSRLTMVPRTFTGGVWAKAVLPTRTTTRNAMRFMKRLRRMGNAHF